MKTAFLGLGDYGSRLAARLVAGGTDVTLIARGERLAALQSEGLKSTKGFGGEEMHIENVSVTGDPSQVGDVDLLILSVKLYQLDQAAYDATPMIGSNTIVLPLFNGVEAPDRLNEILEHGHVLGVSTSPNLPIGEWSRGTSTSTEKAVSMFTDAGIEAVEDEGVFDKVWGKFIVFCGFASICAISRRSVSGVAEHPELKDISMAASMEAAAIGEKAGVSNPRAALKYMENLWDTFPNREWKPSTLQDLEAGKPLETDAGSGAASRLGRKYGVPTPVNDTIYAALKPFENGI
ncbi:MAG: NAD(P)-binding domain-containing protein [Chloroflexi bacterium]|nr:NAD(P)-binding domain-containing protein [Chloroflexota bacterium]